MTKKKKKTKKIKLQTIFIAFFTIAAMVIFTPTTALLLVGMLPTMVAYIVDTSLERNKTFTIGAMNFAGCFPYLIMLWTGENTIYVSLKHLEDPRTIVFIYSIAALGYIINWAVTIVVSSILIKKSEMRLERITEEKQALEERWGKKVNGKYDLDIYGFPVAAGVSDKTEEANAS